MRISDWSSDVCSSDLLWEGIAADPASIPTAVEELLRWVTPLNNMFRTVAADCEVDGVAMRAGDRIALVYTSANRDEEVFEEPFEVERARDRTTTQAFGFGTPFYPSAHEARHSQWIQMDERHKYLPQPHTVAFPHPND